MNRTEPAYTPGIVNSECTTPRATDAALIALCSLHIANRHAFEQGTEDSDEDGPLWAAYCRTRDAIDVARPQTLAGLAAKARATKAEATLPNGAELFDGGPAQRWARDLVHDLLRLHGGAA